AAFDPADLPALAAATLKSAKFPVLATVDGDQPRVRPVSPVRTEGFVVYVANLRRYGKTAELAANPKAELCYTDEDHNQVRITAWAEVVTDRETLEAIWNSNALLRGYLRDINNPELIIYKFLPQRVRYMKEWALEYHEVPLEV
ncbi:MAG TPA: pyridoxamine 5'-phosphate oxidase family protein, partial [Prosthecobacter sp.]